MNPWINVGISSLVYGLAIALIAAMVLIPASYVANRFIYHARMMRIVMIGVAGVASVLLFLAMVVSKFFGLRSVNYLGLLPIMDTTGNSFLDYFLRPLLQIDTEVASVRDNYEGFLLSPTDDRARVPEDLYELGRTLAAIPTLSEWGRLQGSSPQGPAEAQGP